MREEGNTRRLRRGGRKTSCMKVEGRKEGATEREREGGRSTEETITPTQFLPRPEIYYCNTGRRTERIVVSPPPS